MNSKNNESNVAKCFKVCTQKILELLEENKTSLINKALSVCNKIETFYEHTKHFLLTMAENIKNIKRIEKEIGKSLKKKYNIQNIGKSYEIAAQNIKKNNYKFSTYLLLNDNKFAYFNGGQLKICVIKNNTIEKQNTYSSVKITSMCQLENNIIVSAYQQKFTFFDLTKNKPIEKKSEHLNSINKVISLIDNQFATCSNDKTIIIWKFETIEQDISKVSTFTGHTNEVISISFLENKMITPSKENNHKIISSSLDNTIRIWNYSPSNEINQCISIISIFKDMNCCSVNSLYIFDNDTILVGSESSILKIDITKGKNQECKVDGEAKCFTKFNQDHFVCGVYGKPEGKCILININTMEIVSEIEYNKRDTRGIDDTKKDNYDLTDIIENIFIIDEQRFLSCSSKYCKLFSVYELAESYERYKQKTHRNN